MEGASLPAVKREVLDDSVRTFDQRIDALWRICYNEVFGDIPAHIPRDSAQTGIGHITLDDVGFDLGPEEHTRAWYANAILASITVVRLALKDGAASRAASEAVVLGSLVTAAEARLTWSEMAAWNDYREKQRKRARAGAETKRDNAARETKALLAKVAELKMNLPDASAREIARLLLTRQGRDDTPQAVEALSKRIARAKNRP